MNYMKQVSQMLGVELGEEFKIKSNDEIFDNKYYLTERGLDGDLFIFTFAQILRYILIGEYEIVKLPKPILDDKEKEYLSAVIKPFRKKVKHIIKYKVPEGEYISIIYRESENNAYNYMTFPYYEIGTMYKGMEVNKKYTLEELGL